MRSILCSFVSGTIAALLLAGCAQAEKATPAPKMLTPWVRALIVDGEPVDYPWTRMARAADGSYWIVWLHEEMHQLCLARSQDLIEWHGRTVLDTLPPEEKELSPGGRKEKFSPLGSFYLSTDSTGAVLVAYEVFNDPGVFKDPVIRFYRRAAGSGEERWQVGRKDLVGAAVEQWHWTFCCGADGEYLLSTWVQVPSVPGEGKSEIWRSGDLENWQLVGTIPAGVSSFHFLPGADKPYVAVAGNLIFVSADGRTWLRRSGLGRSGEAGVPSLVADEQGEFWALASGRAPFAYSGMWLVRSSDFENWSEPLLTPVSPGYRLGLVATVGGEFVATTATGGAAGFCVFTEEDLRRDTDGDGLRDVEEYRLMTNPEARDTDGDGNPDGNDRNPLASPGPLTPVREVRAAVLKWVMERDPPTGQVAVFVCEGPEDRQEFYGLGPIVLCLTPQELDEFYSRFGRSGTWRGFVKEVAVDEASQSATAQCEALPDPLAAFGCSLELKKIGGEWRVTRVKNGWIS